MIDFSLQIPTKIYFGRDSLSHLEEEVRRYGTRVLLVYGGGSIKRIGLYDKVTAILNGLNCQVWEISGVKPNPRLGPVCDGAALCKERQIDLVLAVGGGSAIDTAKAIAIGAKQPENDLWEIWRQGLPVTERLPVGVVLTIPAAGSETSASAILSDPDTCEKRSVRSPLNVPVFAVLDPQLCATLPRRQVACGVVDILMHTLDRYFNGVFDNETSDALAEAVLRTVVRNGLPAVTDPSDVHAMSELMWCGSLSHNSLTGLGGTRDFAVHKLGNELSACFDIIHAESLSAMWTAWAEYVCASHPQRFTRLGQAVWGLPGDAPAHRTIEAVRAYFQALGMPVSLTELGIPAGQAPRLADCCSQSGQKTIGAFRVLDRQDMERIYTAAY